jgi:hypothetical protein
MITQDGSKEINIICSHCHQKAKLGFAISGAADMSPETIAVDWLILYLNLRIEQWNEEGKVPLGYGFGAPPEDEYKPLRKRE